MKSFLRATAATGIAASTLLAGLGFGPAAANASVTPAQIDGPATSDRQPANFQPGYEARPFKLIAENSPGQFTYMATAGGVLQTVPDRSVAEDNAALVTPVFGDTDSEGRSRWMLRTAYNTCLTSMYSSRGSYVTPTIGCRVSPERIYSLQQGKLRDGNGYWVVSTIQSDRFAIASDEPTNTDFISIPSSFDLTATPKNIDLNSGTADLEGVAPADSANVLVEWEDEAGKTLQKYASVVDGKFSAVLTGLKLGTTKVSLTAYDGSDEVATTTVDVKLDVAPVAAKYAFDDNVRSVVQVSGTGQPNTKVTIKHGEEDLLTVPTDGSGNWSTPVNAPNMPGIYNLTVGQDIRGEDNGRVPLDIDYGAGTTITSPADGFEIEPGETLAIKGTAPSDTEIVVHEKGKSDVLGNTTAGSSNSYLIPVADLEDREYTLVVEGITKGYNRTRAELTVNPGKSTVQDPTADVVFDADVTKKATVTGTGVDGATISIKDENGKTLGTTTVDGGTWSKQIDPIGAGKHTLTIEQTGIEGTQAISRDVDFGAAVAITSPTTEVAPGVVEVTGTTQPGAKVSVAAAGQTVDATVNGTNWTADVVIAPSTDPVTITATQQSKGALKTTASEQVTTTGQQQQVDVAFTDPTDGLYVAPPVGTRLAGTANAFAAVSVRTQWGEVGTTTADAHGNWEIWGVFGPSAVYDLTATQKRLDGSSSTSAALRLSPAAASQHKDAVITTPSGFYDPDTVTPVRGTATPLATIEVTAPWGSLGTTTADQSGDWTFFGQFGPSATYDLTATQTRADDGSTSTSNTITLKPKGNQQSAVVIETPSGLYTPGASTKIAGTASPNAAITINAPWGPLGGTKADQNGAWEYWTHLGPSATYELSATQTREGGGGQSTSNTITLKPDLPANPNAPIVIETPNGEYTPGALTTIRGTAAPEATITVRAAWGTLGTTTADPTGSWVYQDHFGPTANYELTATQLRADGTETSSNTITLTPSTTR